ncbi:MAG TPA: ribose-phosphate diphosphokinase [Planctomycetota bacterium]|jgi:ribose-phosphate pyrophosphokinase
MPASAPKSFAAVIMAAGQGKRMNSDLPKVLHKLNEKPLITWVIDSARAAGATKIVVVVGHGREKVIDVLPTGVEYVTQEKQLGTGHAVRCTEGLLRDWKGPVVVLSGDVPLLRPATIRQLINKLTETDAAAVILTARVDGEHAYGRIVRDDYGMVRSIIEHKDATAEQRKIDEINSGTYAFGASKLFPALNQLRNANSQGEFYLTDTVANLVNSGQNVVAVRALRAQEVMGINTPEELAQAETTLRERMRSGCEVADEQEPQVASELSKNLRIFTGNANVRLAQEICAYLGIPLGEAEVGRFPDGETKVKIMEDIRGRDVFIVQPTSPPVNDHLIELLVLIDAAKRASAQRVTAVIPYFGYARQDRKHEGRVPITAKLVANLITTAGADRVMCIDLHAEQIQGFFDLPVDHLTAAPVLLQHIKELGLSHPTMLSPDLGRTKMSEKFARKLGATLAVIEKRRASDTEVMKGHVVGEIKGRDAIIMDDMIATGGSITQAVNTALEYGAKSVVVGATHPVFSGRAFERLSGLPVRELFVCDTIELKKKPENVNLQVLSVASLLGAAIKRTHRNESVSILFV